jgi:hypothetical protein
MRFTRCMRPLKCPSPATWHISSVIRRGKRKRVPTRRRVSYIASTLDIRNRRCTRSTGCTSWDAPFVRGASLVAPAGSPRIWLLLVARRFGSGGGGAALDVPAGCPGFVRLVAVSRRFFGGGVACARTSPGSMSPLTFLAGAHFTTSGETMESDQSDRNERDP